MMVALDTSALMMPVEVGVRLYDQLDAVLGEYEVGVPRSVLAELDRLAAGGGEAARAASVGRDLAAGRTVLEADADDADDALLELALRGTADAVATNDAPLRERLLDAGVPVIHLRGRSQLTVTNP